MSSIFSHALSRPGSSCRLFTGSLFATFHPMEKRNFCSRSSTFNLMKHLLNLKELAFSWCGSGLLIYLRTTDSILININHLDRKKKYKSPWVLKRKFNLSGNASSICRVQKRLRKPVPRMPLARVTPKTVSQRVVFFFFEILGFRPWLAGTTTGYPPTTILVHSYSLRSVISYIFIHCTETKQEDANDAAALNGLLRLLPTRRWKINSRLLTNRSKTSVLFTLLR